MYPLHASVLGVPGKFTTQGQILTLHEHVDPPREQKIRLRLLLLDMLRMKAMPTMRGISAGFFHLCFLLSNAPRRFQLSFSIKYDALSVGVYFSSNLILFFLRLYALPNKISHFFSVFFFFGV